MTPDTAICLAILAAAVILLAWDRIPADVVAIGVMLAIILTRLLPPEKAFAGFASDTVLMILGLLIMSAGLIQAGIVEIAGRYVSGLAGDDPKLFLPIIMVSVAVVSAFISNTAATAVFVPIVIGYAARAKFAASRFLLPLAFASILTSSVTLISTSTNLIISDQLTNYSQAPMGMFELAPVGLPIAVVGLLYVWAVAPRLLPERPTEEADEQVGTRHYQADILVVDQGPLIGKTLAQSKIADDTGLSVVKLLRGQKTWRGAAEACDVPLEAGDELFIEGQREALLKIKDIDGVEFKADVTLVSPDAEEEDKKATIVEGVLLPHSPLIGRSLSNLAFEQRYGLKVLAIHRAGRLPASISRTRLQLGDVLLLQGRAQDVKALETGNLFNIFGNVVIERLNRRHATLALLIFAFAIAAVTFQLMTLPVAMMTGAFLMLLTGCLSPEEAYRQIEWKAIILIGGLLSLGVAMETTGAGKFLAQQLISVVGNSPAALLTSFFLLTVALTQPMSNQAAALVVLPIAMQVAQESGLNPRTFAMMVAVAASCSYLTPLEPSCLMVYGPGKYRFSDFFKVGAPLTVLIYLIAIVLVPLVWPLKA